LSPKESHQPSPKEDSRPGYQKILWHWLYKHPVEFSKNNHTPTTTTNQVAAAGATPQLYPARFVVSSTGLPVLTLTVRTHAETPTDLRRHAPRGFSRPSAAALSPRTLARFPAGHSHYPTSTPTPNRIEDPPKQSPRRAPVEAGAIRHPPGSPAPPPDLISSSPAGREKVTPTGSRSSNRQTLSRVTLR
jgi:hypothetical protein